jgi:CRP-like cAMP-binding protein
MSRITSTSARAPLFLEQTGWLSDLLPHLRAALLDLSWIKRFDAGDRIYGLGDPPGGLYGLEEGCLALEAAQSDDPPGKGFLIHPGAWIGEGPVAGFDARITGAWATRPSKLLSIEIAAFRRVAAREPDLWRHLVLLGLQNQRRVIGLAQDLMLRGSRQRLAAVLARLAGLREDHPPADPVVDATQGEIGAIANLSRGVVSRLLLEMEAEGLVRLRRASIGIRDPDRLLRSRAIS